MSHFAVLVFAKDENEADRLMAPYQENNVGDCPKQYLKFYPDDESEVDPETGVRGYWENPNAKWDYYRPWSRSRRTVKDRAYPCRVSETAWDATPSERKKAADDWAAIIRGNKDEMFERGLYFKRDYYLEEFGDEETYISENSGLYPWAFITPDGTWHQKGNMGWLAMNDASRESRKKYREELNDAIKSVPQDIMVFMFDCHI